MNASKFLAIASLYGAATFVLLAVDTAIVVEKPVSAPVAPNSASSPALVDPR